MSDTFKVNNLEFQYCRDKYNNAATNERCVEVPMGKWAFDWMVRRGPVVEVGDVLWHYHPEMTGHEIVDLYEGPPREKLLNVNFLDYDHRGKNILSISTIEHFGREEHGRGRNDNGTSFKAAMQRIVADCPFYFITLPRGMCPFVDNFVKFDLLSWKVFMELGDNNLWVQTGGERYDVSRIRHGYYNISVITNIPDFWK